jgi:hypothetical protein
MPCTRGGWATWSWGGKTIAGGRAETRPHGPGLALSLHLQRFSFSSLHLSERPSYKLAVAWAMAWLYYSLPGFHSARQSFLHFECNLHLNGHCMFGISLFFGLFFIDKD